MCIFMYKVTGYYCVALICAFSDALALRFLGKNSQGSRAAFRNEETKTSDGLI